MKATFERVGALSTGPSDFDESVGQSTLRVVPEPSTALLLASGLLAMAVGRRRTVA